MTPYLATEQSYEKKKQCKTQGHNNFGDRHTGSGAQITSLKLFHESKKYKFVIVLNIYFRAYGKFQQLLKRSQTP